MTWRCSWYSPSRLFYSIFFGLLIFSVSWILLFSFNPYIVRVTETQGDIFSHPGAPPDPIKCIIVSAPIAAVLGVFVYIFVLNNFV